MKRLLFLLCTLFTMATLLRAAAQPTDATPTPAAPAPESAAAAATASTAPAYEERPVALERDFGRLYGTLTVPARGAETAVLLIAGSGPTDRDGNNRLGLRCDCYRLLAEELTAAGYAVLRYDKRAIGSSVLDDPTLVAELTLDQYIDDAAALADYLAGEGFRRVVLAGHSEGALIASVAAQRSPAVAGIISLCGAGYPMDEVLRLQLAGQLVPAHMELFVEAEQIIAALKRGERVDMTYHTQGLQALFNSGVQPFIISQMRYDPRQELRKAQVPVLIVGGGNDLQVPADNAEALAAARRDARKCIIPGMAHTLKACAETTLEGQLRTAYGDPALPLAPGLVQAITEFLGSL